MPGYPHAQRSAPLVRPRRALILLGALGAGLVVGRIVDILDYSQPLIYGVAAVLSSCGLTRAETEADPVG